tara:strand:- start:332 stop:484 length:153 start_codon:yes stop_codon:yes gene_type:complete
VELDLLLHGVYSNHGKDDKPLLFSVNQEIHLNASDPVLKLEQAKILKYCT